MANESNYEQSYRRDDPVLKTIVDTHEAAVDLFEIGVEHVEAVARSPFATIQIAQATARRLKDCHLEFAKQMMINHMMFTGPLYQRNWG